MTDDEITVKVEALRKELQEHGRSGEISRTSAYPDVSGNIQNSTRTSRRTSKAVLGHDSKDGGNARSLDSGNRSGDESLTRTGPADNRSTEDISSSSGSYPNDQGTLTRRGRLIPDDNKEITRHPQAGPTTFSIPKRRGPGRPSKNTKADETPGLATISSIPNFDKPDPELYIKTRQPRKTNLIKTWFQEKGSTISDREAQELETDLSEKLIDYGSYIDIYIQYRANKPTLVVFGDLSPDEAKVFARLFIKAGKQDARIASGVRTLAKGNDYLSAIIILWPRIKKLVDAFGKEK